jgi:hypothetical protein
MVGDRNAVKKIWWVLASLFKASKQDSRLPSHECLAMFLRSWFKNYGNDGPTAEVGHWTEIFLVAS